MGESKQRTTQQNRSLHLYFTLVADSLNQAGLDIKTAVDLDIPWTPENVKNLLWRPVQEVMLAKESTTQLTTKEIDQVWEVVNRYLASLGIHEPFPSIEQIINSTRT
jgi:hypothetical protein